MPDVVENIDTQRDADPPMEAGIAPQRGRLPAQIALGHVVLQVSSLERSLQFYTSVLGLAVHQQAGGHAVLGTVDGDMALVGLRERAGARPAHGRLGLYHFAILLPDRSSLGRFVGHLASTGVRAGASDHLVSEALYLRDPDGLGIEVYADRPRATWRARDRELQMASEPLNLDDLLRAAGDAPWKGMPAGTVMGHLHLHVGDLTAATAFYHSALGLDKMVWSYPGALFLAAGGYHHHLGLNTWAGPQAEAPGDSHARLLEWRMILPSTEVLRDVASRVKAEGYPAVQDGADWMVTDPWGTTLRLTTE